MVAGLGVPIFRVFMVVQSKVHVHKSMKIHNYQTLLMCTSSLSSRCLDSIIV